MIQRKTCLTPQQIKIRLRDSGIRPTAQRIAICQYVLCDADHPTVEEVKQWANDHHWEMSLATVYNNLNLLVRAGLLKPVKLSHSDKVFFDNNVEAHYHFLNEETGELIDVMPEEIKISPDLGEDYVISHIEVLVRGKKR